MILKKLNDNVTINKAIAQLLVIYLMALSVMNGLVSDHPYHDTRSRFHYRHQYHEKVSDIMKPIGIMSILKNVAYIEESVPLKSEEIGQEDIVANEYEFENVGYVDATALNIRSRASISSKAIATLSWNSEVHYSKYNDEWFIIQYEDGYGYINSKFITDAQYPENYIAINNDNRKSYMSYKAITSETSKQYKMQENAMTDPNGIRIYNGRYCVAVGTYFTEEVGTYLDVVLEDGTVLPCVVGDIKANCDTDPSNIQGKDSSIVEFIVDMKYLNSDVKVTGDISSIERFSSDICGISLYDENI